MKRVQNVDTDFALETLRGCRAFVAFENADLQKILHMLGTLVADPGDVIFQPEAPANSLYILASGTVVLTTVGNRGPTTIHRFEHGSLIQPFSFLWPGKSIFTANAGTEGATLLELTSGSFKMLELSDPRLANLILRGVIDDLCLPMKALSRFVARQFQRFV